MTREREESGEFAPTVTDEEILDAVEEHEPAATSEVADEVGVVRQTADYRLRDLEEHGAVGRKKIGASLVWYLEDRDAIEVKEESEVGDRADERELSHGEPTPGIDIEEIVAELEIQGAGPAEEARREALVAILEHLREHGEARTQELKDIVEEYPHGFEPGRDSFWGNTWRRDALPELKERGIVESGGSAGVYYWAAE